MGIRSRAILLVLFASACQGTISNAGDPSNVAEPPFCEECPSPVDDTSTFPTFELAPEGPDRRSGVPRLTLDQIEGTWASITGEEVDLSGLLFADAESQSPLFDNSAFMGEMTTAATDLAGGLDVREGLNIHFPCSARDTCNDEEIRSFLEGAFVRRVDDETLRSYRELFDEAANARGPEGRLGPNYGRRAVIRAALVSPYLLYRTEIGVGGMLTPHELAEKLSYLLWNAPPDAELRDAAASGALSAPMMRARQVDRMLVDPRARSGVVRFLRHWLSLDEVVWGERLNVDANPEDRALERSLEEEFARLAQHIVFDEEGSVQDLLLTPETFIDARLAAHYDLAGPAEGFERVRLSEETERRGLLTTGLVIAAHSKEGGRSPMQHGAFIVQDLLCYQFPSAAGAAVGVLPPELDALPPRDAFQALADGLAGPCSECHRMMNVGFALDIFDNVGRRNPSVPSSDAAGHMEFRPTPQVAFESTLDAIGLLAQMPELGRCFSAKLLEYAQGQRPSEADAPLLEEMTTLTQSRDGSVLELLRTFLNSDRFAAAVDR